MERLLALLAALFILAGCPPQVATSSYTNYRLPGSILPDSYHLKIITHLGATANFTFDGQVSIRFQALEDTNNITLHVQNLNVHDSRIQLNTYDDEDYNLCIKGIDTEPELDYYIIRLCHNLNEGQIYKVKLYFSGILTEELHGYYRSSYVDEATNETRWLSLTDFEPIAARAAFPCLDEPYYKAKFIIWLGHHKSLTALSNMPLEKQIALDSLQDFVWSIFKETLPMSTYLVAYSVNDFVYKESKVEGSNVVFRTWSRQGDIDQCDYAAEVGPTILKYFEGVFGIPFPLEKIDEIGIPNFSEGSMENWGLITYQEPYLLVASNVSTLLKKITISKYIAHGLAHQWFGNMVTMKWRTDLWLNEVFATYIASLGVQHISPEFQMYNAESLANSIQMFRTDAEINTHPITHPLIKTSGISVRFVATSLDKRTALLRMLHFFMGQDGFFEGVRDYLTKHKYKNAEQDDLWSAFTEAAHKFNRIEIQHDVKTIMDSWTLQSGYPLVKVSRNYETGSIEISQQRFLKNYNKSDDEAPKCWWIPLSYTTASEFDFTTATPNPWLQCDGSGQSIPLKLDNVAGANEWIIFNIQLSGVYRVMYDPDNWRLLKDTLHSDHYLDIHVMNRVQIIGDALWFAWTGYHDYDITFDILEYLNKEREYLPWQTAFDGLSDIVNLLEHFPQHQSYFYAYMRYIIEPIYYCVDDTIEAGMMPFQVAHKSLVAEWACRIEVHDCVQTAIVYFQQWKLSRNPDVVNKIPAELRYSVYCTAVRHGDEDDWTFLWQRYKQSNLDTEKSTIIKSLACSRNATLLRDFIGLIFNKEIRVRQKDAVIAFDLITNSEICALIAREYYASFNTDLNVDALLDILSVRIDSIEIVNRLFTLLDSHKKYFKYSEKFIQSYVESTNFKIKWIQQNLEGMKSHIQSRLSALGILEGNVYD